MKRSVAVPPHPPASAQQPVPAIGGPRLTPQPLDEAAVDLHAAQSLHRVQQRVAGVFRDGLPVRMVEDEQPAGVVHGAHDLRRRQLARRQRVGWSQMHQRLPLRRADFHRRQQTQGGVRPVIGGIGETVVLAEREIIVAGLLVRPQQLRRRLVTVRQRGVPVVVATQPAGRCVGLEIGVLKMAAVAVTVRRSALRRRRSSGRTSPTGGWRCSSVRGGRGFRPTPFPSYSRVR